MSKGYGYIEYGIGLYGESGQTAFSIAAKKMTTQGTLLLEVKLDGKTLYLSDKYIIVDSYSYEGIVQEFGLNDISAGSNGIGEQSDVSITLQNNRLAYMTTENRISDMLASYNFEGRQATIRQHFDGLTYAECNVLFSGKIQNVNFDDLHFTFDIVDDDDVFKTIPINRISKQAYSKAPSESIGIPKPVIYGKSLTRGIRSTKNWTLFPTVQIEKDNLKYMMADHIIGADVFPDVTAPMNIPYMYIEELKSYLIYNTAPNAVYSNTESDCSISFKNTATWSLLLRPTQKGDDYDCADTDYIKATDEDDTTSLTIEAGESFYLTFGTLPDLGPIDADHLTIRVDIDSVTGSSPYASMYYINDDYNGGAGGTSIGTNIETADVTAGYKNYSFGGDRAAHGDATGQEDQTAAWQWSELAKYQFGIKAAAGCTITITDFYLIAEHLSFDVNRTTRLVHRDTKRGSL